MKSIKAPWLRWIFRSIFLILTLFFLPVGCKVASHYTGAGDRTAWWELRTDSSVQAPSPDETPEAIIQVYSARAARWRGAFGVHTWIATKKTDEQRYTRIEVIGYALRWGGNPVRVRTGSPDSYWYGNKPHLLRELRASSSDNEEVDRLIDVLHSAAANYPYQDTYNVWPGPNSNTFIAHLAREVPELGLELPATAIGKDYLPNNAIIARTPSHTGFQLSISGLFGFLIALEEGIEVNFLGLTAGIDAYPPAIKLPGIGRIGFRDVKHHIIPEP